MTTSRPRRPHLVLAAWLVTVGCYGNSGNDTSDSSGSIAGTLSLRARWEQADGSFSANLPGIVHTIRVTLLAQLEDGTQSRCCLAINPRNIPIDPSSGTRRFALDDLQRGSTEVALDGFHTEFAPALTPSDSMCITSPRGIGAACDGEKLAAPAFSGASERIAVVPGSNTMAPDIALYSRPFVLSAFPDLDSNHLNPVAFEYVVVDALHSIRPDSLALTASSIAQAATHDTCVDGSASPCSTLGNNGLNGVRLRTGPVRIGPGLVPIRLQAASNAASALPLDFAYSFTTVDPPTPTSTPSHSPTSTPSRTPSTTASRTASSTPTSTSTRTASFTPTPTLTPSPTITLTPRPPRELAFVANSASSDVTVVDIVGESVVTTIPTQAQPQGLAIGANGRLLFVTNAAAASLSVVDTRKLIVTKTIPVAAGPSAVAVSPKQAIAYAISRPANTLSVIDTQTLELIHAAELAGGAHDVTFTPDGALALVTLEAAGSLALVNTTTHVSEETLSVGARPQHVSLTADGSTAYVTDAGMLALIEVDIARRRVLEPIPLGNVPGVVVTAQDGALVYVLTPADGSIAVVDRTRRERVATIAGFTRPSGAALSLDGTTLFISNRAINTLTLVSTKTTGIRRAIPTGDSPATVITGLIPLD